MALGAGLSQIGPTLKFFAIEPDGDIKSGTDPNLGISRRE